MDHGELERSRLVREEMAETQLHFESLEGVDDFVRRFPHGSIFWTINGKPKTVVSCLKRATVNKLDYDVAAEVYVCPDCKSCATSIVYFQLYHYDCKERQWNHESLVQSGHDFKIIPTFEVYPRYCSQEQESSVLQWMKETIERTDEPSIVEVRQVQFYNTHTDLVETRFKEVEMDEFKQDSLIQTISLRKKFSGSAKAKLAQHKINKLLMRTEEIDTLIKETIELCNERGTRVQFVDVKHNRCFPRLPLKHMQPTPNQEQIVLHGDVYPDTLQFISQYQDIAMKTRNVREYEFQKGSSGIILHIDDLEDEPQMRERCTGNLFVVMGRCEHGELVNALSPHCLEGIELYSDEKFQRMHAIFSNFHDTRHEFKPVEYNVANWEAFTLWAVAMSPVHMKCKDCNFPADMYSYVTRMRGSSALKELERRTNEPHRSYARWANAIINKLSTLHVQEEENTTMNRFFMHGAPLGPLYNVAESMNAAVIEVQRTAQFVQRYINDANMNEQQRNTAILNEINKLQQNSYLQTGKLTERFEQIARTHQATISAVSQPLSIHSMRQLLMDSRMDESYEFDIMRKQGSIAAVAPNAFRVFDNVYISPNVYDPVWTNLVPSGRLVTDLDFLRLDLTMDILKTKEHLTSDRPITPETCNVEIGRVAVSFCEKIDRCHVPIPHILRIGAPSNPTMIKIQDVAGVQTFVPRPGYCYVLQFVVMLGYIPDALVKPFVNEIGAVTRQLGAWPTFLEFLGVIKNLIIKFPTTIKAPTVLYIVDHTGGTIHAMSTLGCVNKHEHYLSLQSVAQLHDAAVTTNLNHFSQYKIGGAMPDLKLLLKSETEFLRVLEEKPLWLVHILTSPTQIWALSRCAVKYQIAEKVLQTNPDMALALTQLITMSKKFSIFERMDVVINSYFDSMKQLHAISGTILGHNDEYFRTALSQYAAMRYATDIVSLMDQFSTKKKTIEDLEMYYRQTTPELLIEAGLLSRSEFGTGKFVLRELKKSGGRIGSTARSLGACLIKVKYISPKEVWNGTKSTLSLPPWYLLRCGTWLWNSGKRATVGQMVTYGVNCFKRNMQAVLFDTAVYAMITTLILIVIKVLRKLFKKVEALIKNDDGGEDTYVMHAKGKTESMFIKALAWIALIAGCFDMGLGNDIYFATTKFRSLLDVVTTTSSEQFIFHAGSEIEEQEQMEELVTRDHFVDYVYNHSDPLMDFDPETLEGWYTRISYQGRILEHPLRTGDTINLSDQSIDAAALAITKMASKEVTVIGSVGSGKSTKLPIAVSKYGPVLILVPSRELVNNLATSIWFVGQKQVSTFMMNEVHRGASNISVMTYGYALAFFYNNPEALRTYRYVQMDECHEFSAHMITFYAWWKDAGKFTKLYKTTATPPGSQVVNGLVPTNHKVDVQEIKLVNVQEFCRRSVEQHAEGLRTLFPSGGRIIMFIPSRRECDMARGMLTNIPGARVWVVYKTATQNTTKLLADLQSDRHEYQIILTTTVLQNGVNLDPDGAVDFGMTFEPTYDRDGRQLTVRKRNINPSELIQRVGRVGRNKPGKFVQVGKLLQSENVPNACCVTDAILMSFVMELPPFISAHLIDEVSAVTREQVRTAMKFSAPLMFMIHYVRRDGRMLEGFYNLFKGLLLQTSDVALCENLVGDAEINSYRTLRAYQRSGVIEHEELLPDDPIPFYSGEFALPFFIEIGRITREAIKSRSYTVRVHTPDVKKAVMRLSTSKTHIDDTIGILRTRLNLTRQRLEKFDELKATASQIRLTPLFNHCFSSATAKSERALRTSLQVGEELLSALELARVEKRDSALETLIKDNPILGDCLIFHGGPEKYYDEILFPRNGTLISKQIVAIVCLGVALACATWFYLRKRERYIFHGKVRARQAGFVQPNQFEESGERQAHEWHGTDKVIGETFGQAYTRKYKGKLKPNENNNNKAKWDSREGNQTSVYKTLYDLDPTKYKYVVVECPEFELKKKLNRQEKKSLATTITETCRRKLEERGVVDFPGVERAIVYLFNDDGVGHKVQLTPHNPLVISQTTTQPVGFPDKAGQLRQTGRAMEMTPEERAKALEETYIQHARCQIDISHIERHIAIVSTGGLFTQCFIAQDICVAPYHLATDFTSEQRIKIHCSNGVFTMPVPNVKKMKGTDIVLFQMPQDFPPLKRCRMLRKPTKEDEVILITGVRTKSGIHVQFSAVVSIRPLASGAWKYMIDSEPGICGGVVMSVNDNKIVGFHSAGVLSGLVDNGAIFSPVNDEMIKAFDEGFTSEAEWKFNEELLSWKAIPSHMDPRNFPVSNSLAEYVFHAANDRGHMSDKYYGDNLTIEGRILRTFNNRHVIKGLDDSFAEFVNQNPEVPGNLFEHLPSDLSVEAFNKDFFKYSGPVELGKVDIEMFNLAIDQVIEHLQAQGFGQKEFHVEYDFYKILNSFNLDTAMGALYQVKKKDVLPMATHEQLEDWFFGSMANLIDGKLGLWKASLKAELRPKEKVLAHKTRVFTAAPFDVLFGAKAFVDEFNNRFYERQTGSNWTVGINKFNCGWDELARRFNPKWKFIDADGSRYDSSLTPLMFNAIIRIREHFMELNDVERIAFRNFYTQLVWTPITTITGQVVKKHKGGPSGQPSTVVDNTLMLMVAMEYARMYANVHDVHYTCNGDDLLINAPTESCRLIRDNFSEAFAQLGLTYEFEQEVDSIGDVEYMSHNWVDAAGILIPKLKKERILSVLQWNKSLDLDSQANKINAAWIESFGYADLMEYVRNYAEWWSLRHDKIGFLCSPEKVASLYLTNDIQINVEEQEQYIMHAGVDNQGVVPPVPADQQAQPPGQQQPIIPPAPANGGGQQQGQPAAQPANLNNTVANTTAGFYVPPIMRSIVTTEMAKTMSNYNPPDALISTQACSLEQFGKWARAASAGLGLSLEQFNTEVIPYWVYWCVVNGASDQHKRLPHWTKVGMTVNEETGDIVLDENAPQVLFEMEPMFIQAKPTLRAVMRHLGALAYRWVKFSIIKGRAIKPHNAIKAGLTDQTYFPCSIDFVTADQLTPEEIDVRNQVINARVNERSKPLFKHAQRPGASEEDTDLRRDDDANYGRTRVGGALFSSH